jgi:hypothetical protein
MEYQSVGEIKRRRKSPYNAGRLAREILRGNEASSSEEGSGELHDGDEEERLVSWNFRTAVSANCCFFV